MEPSRILELISPCGLYCGGCPLFQACTDKALAERLAKNRGVSVDKVPTCYGCRAEKGEMSFIGEPVCSTYKCITEKGLHFCYECADFPCLKLAPCADRAQEIPHNTKIYNLLLIQKQGLENWAKNAETSRRQYFRGKKPRPGAEIQMP